MASSFIFLFLLLLIAGNNAVVTGFVPTTSWTHLDFNRYGSCLCIQQRQPKKGCSFITSSSLFGWLDNFLPAPQNIIDDARSDENRRLEFPEQYPASYEMSSVVVPSDKGSDGIKLLVRPLLKQTMLEERELQLSYSSAHHGWTPQAFHTCVDGKGAAVVVATYKTPIKGADDDASGSRTSTLTIGGYNPKGWSSNGGARPSVAAFLFYQTQQQQQQSSSRRFTKLRKVGGGGLACARDDFDYGISFGPDALVIPLGTDRTATSKLGPYFERGQENRSSLFSDSTGASISSVKIESLKVLTGVYRKDEEIPYSGAVMDMTSG